MYSAHKYIYIHIIPYTYTKDVFPFFLLASSTGKEKLCFSSSDLAEGLREEIGEEQQALRAYV